MINIALHIIFVLVVLYYVFINNTDYDRSLYQSTNDIHKYLYKKQISNKRYIKYNEKQNNKEEDRLEHIQKKNKCKVSFQAVLRSYFLFFYFNIKFEILIK